MFAKALAIVAAGASVVSATCTYPPPLANQLPGNSVTRPDLTNPATIGTPFDIIWDATGLTGTVSLILLRGPGDNIQFLEYIVQGTANSGKYTWTPECTLEPDTTHYGIMLLADDTCQFQWSTQFGLNAGSCSSSSTSSTPPKSSSTTSSATAPPPSSTGGHGGHGGSSSSEVPPPPKTWTTGYGGGSWGNNGTSGSTSTSTYYLPAGTGGAPAPSSTYHPAQSNDGARYGMSLFGAAAALAAVAMIC